MSLCLFRLFWSDSQPKSDSSFSMLHNLVAPVMIRAELWPTGCGVNIRLYQNMSNFKIDYESVSARSRFWLNPQPHPSTLYSYNPNVDIFVIK